MGSPPQTRIDQRRLTSNGMGCLRERRFRHRVTGRVRLPAMARVVVDVMPKPEILDPQGKAVTGALARLGFAGMSVRQGKRFELEVDGDLTEERLAEVRRAAETLLANTVIETFNVRVEAPPESSDEAEDDAESDEQAELATQAG
jgi:phosphoribosylformylglycinamidine synthase subunit PurS